MRKLDIIFRSCDRVNCFSGRPRDLVPNITKKDVIEKSYRSLIKAISSYRALDNTTEISLVVVDDHSSAETLDMLSYNNVASEIITPNYSGNGASFDECLQYARRNADDLVFFVEDDYIHELSLIREMLYAQPNFTDAFGTQVSLHPCDYPDRYRKLLKGYVPLGRERHWRQITQTTCTFLTHMEVLDRNWDAVSKFKEYGITPGVNEDNTINTMYAGSEYCFSPIPTLSVHFQYFDTLSPLHDWRKLWDSIV